MKICQKGHSKFVKLGSKVCELTFKELPKTFQILPKWRNFAKLVTPVLALMKVYFKMGQTQPLFCLFSFFSHDKYTINTIIEKAQMLCLGLEPGVAG